MQLIDAIPIDCARSSAATENPGVVLVQLRLAAGNLVRVHVTMPSKLRNRLLALEGGQSHLRFEGR